MVKVTAEGSCVFIRCDEPGRIPIALTRSSARVLLEAIDAGHLDALRHYAEHGALPVEAPTWPGAKLSRLPGATGLAWHVTNLAGKLIATVAQPMPPSGGWQATVHGSIGGPPSVTHTADTAQEAVDKARAALAAFWGLST